MRRGCWCSMATRCATGWSATCRANCARGDLLVFNDTRVIPAQLEGTARRGADRRDAAQARGAAALARVRPQRQAAARRRRRSISATASARPHATAARTAAGVPKSHLLGDEPGRLARGKSRLHMGRGGAPPTPSASTFEPPPKQEQCFKRAARPRRDEMSHTLPRKFTNTLVSFRGAAPPQHVVSCYAHRRSFPAHSGNERILF